MLQVITQTTLLSDLAQDESSEQHHSPAAHYSLIEGVFVQGQQASIGDGVSRVAPAALVQQEVLLPYNSPTTQQAPLAGQQALVNDEQAVALIALSHHRLQQAHVTPLLLLPLYIMYVLPKCTRSSLMVANTLMLDDKGMMHVKSMPPTGGVTLTLQVEATWVQDNQAGRTPEHVLIQWCWACTRSACNKTAL